MRINVAHVASQIKPSCGPTARADSARDAASSAAMCSEVEPDGERERCLSASSCATRQDCAALELRSLGTSCRASISTRAVRETPSSGWAACLQPELRQGARAPHPTAARTAPASSSANAFATAAPEMRGFTRRTRAALCCGARAALRMGSRRAALGTRKSRGREKRASRFRGRDRALRCGRHGSPVRALWAVVRAPRGCRAMLQSRQAGAGSAQRTKLRAGATLVCSCSPRPSRCECSTTLKNS